MGAEEVGRYRAGTEGSEDCLSLCLHPEENAREGPKGTESS